VTQDNGMTRSAGSVVGPLIVCERVIECAEAMAQELQDTLDAMREASGDDSDGQHLELLIAEWERINRLLKEWEEQ